jgi:hypothetical protein
MAVVSIEYNDGNKKDLGYRSVDISYNGSKNKKSFNSGDFVKDWYDCTKLVVTKIHGKEYISNSSSVDHFIMDGAKFDSAYLKSVKSKAELVYDDNADGQGIEFFVVEGTKPTWEELQKLCGHNLRVKKEKSKKQLSNKLN